jgi:hypothetical protein
MVDHLTPGPRRGGAPHDLTAYPAPSAKAIARGKAVATNRFSATGASAAAHEAHASAQLKKALVVAKGKARGVANRG